jgi:hypothetical protein
VGLCVLGVLLADVAPQGLLALLLLLVYYLLLLAQDRVYLAHLVLVLALVDHQELYLAVDVVQQLG